MTFDKHILTAYYMQMKITEPQESRPYLTAASAAKELGYAPGRSHLTTLCAAGKVPGAYRDGRIWLVPATWVEEQKKSDAAAGIERGTGRIGRPVTTGAGLKRKRPAYKPTGKPMGRPKKTP